MSIFLGGFFAMLILGAWGVPYWWAVLAVLPATVLEFLESKICHDDRN